MKRTWLTVVTMVVAASVSGCIVFAAAAGGAGVGYAMGKAEKQYAHGVEKTFDATLAALKEANVVVYSKGADATSGKIEGTLADGKKLTIDLKAAGQGVTKVKMRIGTWGDKDRYQYIFSLIDKRL